MTHTKKDIWDYFFEVECNNKANKHTQYKKEISNFKSIGIIVKKVTFLYS